MRPARRRFSAWSNTRNRVTPCTERRSVTTVAAQAATRLPTSASLPNTGATLRTCGGSPAHGSSAICVAAIIGPGRAASQPAGSAPSQCVSRQPESSAGPVSLMNVKL